MQKTNDCPYEEEEQITVIQYLEALKFQNHKVKYTAIPASTFTKSWNAKRKNTAMGVRPGFPDLFIIINNIPFLIEMKRVRGGTVSAEQKEWIKDLNDAKLQAFVCKGADEAKSVIDSVIHLYLKKEASRLDS